MIRKRIVIVKFIFLKKVRYLEMKSIQLHDYIEGLSQKIVSSTLHYFTSSIQLISENLWVSHGIDVEFI